MFNSTKWRCVISLLAFTIDAVQGDDNKETEALALLNQWVASGGLVTDGPIEDIRFKNALPRAIADYAKSSRMKLNDFKNLFGFSDSQVKVIGGLNSERFYLIRIPGRYLIFLDCSFFIDFDRKQREEDPRIIFITVLPDTYAPDASINDIIKVIWAGLRMPPAGNLRPYAKAIIAATDSADERYQELLESGALEHGEDNTVPLDEQKRIQQSTKTE